jgi:hypothetical protein
MSYRLRHLTHSWLQVPRQNADLPPVCPACGLCGPLNRDRVNHHWRYGLVLCASFDLGNLICHALQNVQNTGAQNAAFL